MVRAHLSLGLAAVLALHAVSAQAAGGREEFEKAVKYFNIEEYEAALPFFRKAYRLSGKRPSTIVALAQCLRQLGKLQEALTYFEAYVAVEPPPPNVVDVQGTIELMRDLIAAKKAKQDALDGALDRLGDRGAQTATATAEAPEAEPIPAPEPAPASAATPAIGDEADDTPAIGDEAADTPAIGATPPAPVEDTYEDEEPAPVEDTYEDEEPAPVEDTYEDVEPASAAGAAVGATADPDSVDPNAASDESRPAEDDPGSVRRKDAKPGLTNKHMPSVTDEQWSQWEKDAPAVESSSGGTGWIIAILLIATGAAVGSYLYLDGTAYRGNTGVLVDPNGLE